ncbi:MAG: nucleotidyltransferase [Eubacterium sp.]|nr:nucleotidyltransferase [Eubacterium sp.]
MKKTTLTVMAAGIGSRFGKGIKQLEPVGPEGQIIMDYSIHDALEAGFNKVVFIIRRDLEKDFREIIGNRIEKITEVAYAFQELDDLPAGFSCPPGRTKPWGTGQAIMACEQVIREPFMVINADDYYGKEPFFKLYQYLNAEHDLPEGVQPICMAGYRLGNTLSENGGVTRGVCRVDAQNHLTGITETYNIIKTPGGAAVVTDGKEEAIDAATPVSMNMWGLQAEFLPLLRDRFAAFLSGLEKDDIKAEFLLPGVIDDLLQSGKACVDVLDTSESWFGVTYQEDKEPVKQAFRELIRNGVYSEGLWDA